MEGHRPMQRKNQVQSTHVKVCGEHVIRLRKHVWSRRLLGIRPWEENENYINYFHFSWRIYYGFLQQKKPHRHHKTAHIPNVSKQTIFILGKQVVLGLDVRLEGVHILLLISLHISCDTLEDVVWGGRTAAGATLRTARVWLNVVLICFFIFLCKRLHKRIRGGQLYGGLWVNGL